MFACPTSVRNGRIVNSLIRAMAINRHGQPIGTVSAAQHVPISPIILGVFGTVKYDQNICTRHQCEVAEPGNVIRLKNYNSASQVELLNQGSGAPRATNCCISNLRILITSPTNVLMCIQIRHSLSVLRTSSQLLYLRITPSKRLRTFFITS